MSIGELIRFYRLREGWTQAVLADSIGVTSTYISHLENNHAEPSIALLRKIGNYLHVKIFIKFDMGPQGMAADIINFLDSRPDGWYDLLENPDDLPETEDGVLLIYSSTYGDILQSIGFIDNELPGWFFRGLEPLEEHDCKPIAWRELPAIPARFKAQETG